MSTICGMRGTGRSIWGVWLGRLEQPRLPWVRCAVSPGPNVEDARKAIEFADSCAVLFVPESNSFAESLRCAIELAQTDIRVPVGLVAEPIAVVNTLEGQSNESEEDKVLRQVLIGGLVVLDRQVEALMNRSTLRKGERPLYRSDQELVLHTLIEHEKEILEEFVTNRRVRGASTKAYEVDLWCESLRFAIEVDGAQHISKPEQKNRDAARDSDLANAGVRTIRVHASEVMSDPTKVIAFLKKEIEKRRTDV